MLLLLFLVLDCSAQCVTEEQCNDIRLNARYWLTDSEHDPYNDADLIIEGLYLGNVCAAHNETWLDQHNVSLIVNVAKEWVEQCWKGRTTLNCGLDDSVGENMERTMHCFEEIAFALNQHLDAGQTALVHCNMGISRSSSAVLYYLQKRRPQKPYRKLLALVKARRSCVKPNDLFGRILTNSEL
jgi:hypothetical protein